MTPLTQQKVYIEVSVKDELPEENTQPFCISDDGNCCPVYSDFEFRDWSLLEEGTGRPTDIAEFITHFLKEQKGYFLSKQELESLLDNVYVRGWQDRAGESIEPFAQEIEDKNDYIRSILT